VCECSKYTAKHTHMHAQRYERTICTAGSFSLGNAPPHTQVHNHIHTQIQIHADTNTRAHEHERTICSAGSFNLGMYRAASLYASLSTHASTKGWKPTGGLPLPGKER
jgi:hypothetical protein